MSVDHGTVRCGLAISDASGTIARPLGEIEPDAAAIAARAAAEEAGEIVVGLPLTPSGEHGEQARLAEAFAAQLRDAAQVPVTTYDERLTTSQAQASRRAGAQASVDAVAAAHLLDTYLTAKQAGAA